MISLIIAGSFSCTNDKIEQTNPYLASQPEANLPEVDFSCSSTAGEAPFSVTFTPLFQGQISDWQWDFGDGQWSKTQQADHTYLLPGDYTVSLQVTSAGGKSRETKTNFITVFEKTMASVQVTPYTSNVTNIQKTPEPAEINNYISWKDAGKYIGQNKTIEGTIVSAYYASGSNGKPTFLDFNVPYQGYFICLIWGSERSRFVEAFPPNPETYFMNKRVLVSGMIEEYPSGSSNPEIVLTQVTQIKIVGNN